MSRPPRYACILTHNRHDLLRRLVGQLIPQLDAENDVIIVLDNASDPAVGYGTFDDLPRMGIFIRPIPDQPPNLAYNMNQGFEFAEGVARKTWRADTWDVAMLCDDVILPEDWFDRVSGYLRNSPAVAASTATVRPADAPVLKTAPDSDIMNRMMGSAFMVKGEAGLRADESMRWWWQDTDLDWQARALGGMILVPGPIAVNERPNDFTVNRPELGQQAGRDGNSFVAKWGWRPW